MMYTKLEMYDMLADCVGLGQDTLDILIKVLGDTADSYKKILAKTTNFKTFQELEAYYQVTDDVGDFDYESEEEKW